MLGVAAVTGGHRGEQPQHYKTDGTADEVPEAVVEGGPILNGRNHFLIVTDPNGAHLQLVERTVGP